MELVRMRTQILDIQIGPTYRELRNILHDS